ncbi:PhoX family protein [Paucibacter sp. DJ2R-2]|uniref:PhoX family protein n=1 Tax=Paucibacter sp. DJ2R-2 TaxID=2893558 RepID=UPI0021E50D1F|nr:PhoX family protein [Paucibacter sp. DJ2R-2]MCV2421428.1 PhoX family protein [Paucibacter sp. DJ4R-1]MCV2438110.1 PhoX family protein [Paucibacter sp. DJ2R-2]
MSKTPQTSRRQALKFLSTPLMLPLGGLGASLSLTACGGGDDDFPAPTPVPVPVNYVSAAFTAMAALDLSKPAAMATTTVASTLDVSLSNGSKQSFKLAYQAFFLTGDAVPDGKGGTIQAGSYYDINNKPIIDTTVAGKDRQFFSDSPDGTSLLSVANPTVTGIKGKAVFAVVQFEYTTWAQDGKTDMYGKLPSPIAVLTLDQDQTTGKLSLVKYHNVDTSSANGLWITCGSSLSPWGTHLSSEEYEPDAFTIASNTMFKAFSKNLFGDETKANPYHYGHMPEVTVNPDGTGSIKKHYCLGRISHELIEVMPDKRTAIMGDDATNGGFFMFVADKEADLSAGTLYVAKVGAGFSIDPAAAGAALTWIKLGSATSAEIKKLADTLKPTDIMDVATVDPKDASFTKIYFSGKVQWVKLKPGMEKAAAFLETHRYAALMGGSMAFTKMEGTTVNIKDKIAYSALQNMQSSMVKGNAANNPDYGVVIDKTVNAGAVLAHTLSGGQKDTAGAAISSEWVPSLTKALLVGEDIAADALGNLANPDKIGAPDNLKFSEKLRTLFIGEDSGYHVNNFVWAYNVDTKVLSRLVSMPSGAEATGLGVVDDLNGWTYITSNFQHPGDWSASLHSKVQATLDPLVRANYKDRFGAAVGYLTAEATSIKLNKL